MRKRYASALAVLALALGYGAGSQPLPEAEGPAPVLEPEVIVKTEKIYVDRPVEVIVEVPAEYPRTCKRVASRIEEFHLNLRDLDSNAGKILDLAGNLQRQSVNREPQAMVETIDKMNQHLGVLDTAAASHFNLWDAYQRSVKLCKTDLN